MKQGISAAAANKLIRRCKPIPINASPSIYTVYEIGTFKIVAALCPKVKASTLKRRLDTGERRLDLLRRPPDKKHK